MARDAGSNLRAGVFWLIDAGYADGVMTSHIVNRNLDKSGLPGTLSKEILDGILRKRLGYTGVVFSDDMQMQAIAKHYSLEETIRLAINAGVDIMCFSNNIQGSEERTVDKVHSIIKSMVAIGQITQERIDESYRRILKLKEKLNAPDVASYEAEITRLQKEVSALNEKVKASEKDEVPETKRSKRKKRKSKS